MSLRTDLRVYIGIPMLKRHDQYEGYLKSCLHHISNQDADVDILTPYVSSGTSMKWRVGDKSHLYAITEQLNEVVEAGMDTKADIICIVDADVEIPPNWLRELLLLDVDVASGVYTYHESSIVTFGHLSPTKKFELTRTDLQNIRGRILGEHHQVGGGNGCMVMKRRVLERHHPKIAPLRFRCPDGAASDIHFWWAAQQVGFTARVHGGIVCGHLPQKKLVDIALWG